MTLEELERMPDEFLSLKIVAEYMGAHPDTIAKQARKDPMKLGFPVIVCGNRTRVPRAAFIYFCKYGCPYISTNMELDVVKYFIEQAMSNLIAAEKGGK